MKLFEELPDEVEFDDEDCSKEDQSCNQSEDQCVVIEGLRNYGIDHEILLRVRSSVSDSLQLNIQTVNIARVFLLFQTLAIWREVGHVQ